MMDKQFYVYIMSNWNNKVVYVGITNNIILRVYEHKNGLGGQFTSRYNVSKLVYYECHHCFESAERREKYLKVKKRAFKDDLINGMNPTWKDLYKDL